jgi:hypothetical protein
MIEATMPTAATASGKTKNSGDLLEVPAKMKPRGEGDRGDDRAGVGLEQVGAHAGDVADVVAHVVGDGRRVAGVVLGDAGLDLADEVGADVGGLGVDAAADTGEQRDRRGAETEGGDTWKASSTSSHSTNTR